MARQGEGETRSRFSISDGGGAINSWDPARRRLSSRYSLDHRGLCSRLRIRESLASFVEGPAPRLVPQEGRPGASSTRSSAVRISSRCIPLAAACSISCTPARTSRASVCSKKYRAETCGADQEHTQPSSWRPPQTAKRNRRRRTQLRRIPPKRPDIRRCSGVRGESVSPGFLRLVR